MKLSNSASPRPFSNGAKAATLQKRFPSYLPSSPTEIALEKWTLVIRVSGCMTSHPQLSYGYCSHLSGVTDMWKLGDSASLALQLSRLQLRDVRMRRSNSLPARTSWGHPMNHLMIAALGAVLVSIGSPAPAAPRTYDCSKPGNANKAVCKNAAKAAATAAAKSAPAAKAKPSATKVSSTTVTKTVTERNYDCSKPGNKNKPVCKAAATPAKPVVQQTSVATSTRHYDCTKAGNANKEQCKASVASHQTTAKPSPVPSPARAPAAKTSVPTKPAAKTTAAANENSPAGATAQCKDGTYSHAKTHQGACSHHGGVAKWLS